MDSGHMFPLLVVLILVVTILLPTHGYQKRLLMNNPPELESRLHQMELIIQSLTAKVDGLTSQMSEKNSQISQLQSTVSKLGYRNDNQDSQIQSLQKTVNTQKPGCQTGSHRLEDSHGHANKSSTNIHFNPPFNEIPKIVWGTTALDVDHAHNTRYKTTVQSVTTYGFTLNVYSWADTGMYKVYIQWMACPTHN